jgi:integrase
VDELTEAQWKRLDEALPDIPNRDNISRKFSGTFFQRYQYAEQTKWSKLERVTTTTIKSRYWAGLYKFVDFAIAEKFYRSLRPKFVCIDPENLTPLPRDAFDDDELLRLLRLPLFTGCKNRVDVWQPGGYFVQSHIYWGFLICILTGMRPDEVGRLKCADIRTNGEFYYFDLRPFDARNGRVALQDLRNLKTNAAGAGDSDSPFAHRIGPPRADAGFDGQRRRETISRMGILCPDEGRRRSLVAAAEQGLPVSKEAPGDRSRRPHLVQHETPHGRLAG